MLKFLGWQHFQHDKLTLCLLIPLLFLIGFTISQAYFGIDYELIKRNAEGLTKEEAQAQYDQREHARIVQNGTSVQLLGPKLDVIAVDLKRVCWNLVKANITSQCPNYEELAKFDTTNQKYIGKFVYKNGVFQREKSFYKNLSFFVKNTKETIVCVNCPSDIWKFAKQIEVDLPFVYKLDSDKKIINNTRIEYHNRYVENCAYARIAWLPNLLNDTINYLKSGCTQTDFNATVSIFTPYKQYDYKTSKAFKEKQWMDQAKQKAKELAELYCKKPTSKCK